jgi:hypothetical protein
MMGWKIDSVPEIGMLDYLNQRQLVHGFDSKHVHDQNVRRFTPKTFHY